MFFGVGGDFAGGGLCLGGNTGVPPSVSNPDKEGTTVCSLSLSLSPAVFSRIFFDS